MNNYNRKQRRAIAAALRAAKKYLWDGIGDRSPHQKYICFALRETGCVGAMDARNMIEDRLTVNGHHRTAYSWLNVVAGIPEFQLSPLAVQEYRHRWVDALIAEFSE